MNREQFLGICQQFEGWMNETWGELTSDPLRTAAGTRARIFGKARQRRGIAKDDAERQMKDFLDRNRNWHF